MADFRPTTTIYIFKNCGVDDGNQPYFDSEGAKLSWYQGRPTKRYTNYSWLREARNRVRVQDKATDLYEYDMLAFQNEDGRWIFNRIINVSFINPNTTEITYQIDWTQTCMGFIEWCECWVEREMQSNDWNGGEPSWNNLQPEGLETGVMTRTPINGAMIQLGFDQFDLVVYSAYDAEGEPNYDIQVEAGYPTGLNRIVFALSDGGLGAFNSMMKNYEEKGIDLTTAIVGLYVTPREYLYGPGTSKVVNITPNFNAIAGVPIVNAKCFTSEFFTLEVSNRQGIAQEYRPEQFTETTDISLVRVCANGAGNGGAMVYARGYEGFPQDFGVILPNDIQAPFVTNSYASWQAKNAASIGVDLLKSTASGAAAGSAAGPGGAIAGGLAGAATSVAKLWDRSKDPVGVGGQVAGAVLQLQLGIYGFSVNWVHPRAANIRCIDQYFSRWGYRTNRFKKPNVNTRPKWNFVKTNGAVVKGRFNAEAKEAIQRLMDNGVTYWNVQNGIEIGDFSDPITNRE